MSVISNPRIYRIQNLTEKRVRFQYGRHFIRFEPLESKEFDITTNPEIQMLIDEIPNTHNGLFKITQPYIKLIEKEEEE